MTKRQKDYSLYLFTFFIFIYASNYGLPVEVIPDETAQLKNIYAMINSKSLFLQYDSSYSIWTHYFYILPTLIYWGVFYIFSPLQSIAELKFYVMNHYQEVLTFLRISTAGTFLISLIMVKRVLEDRLNVVQAYLFYLFIALNLLVVINVHYAKHWMADFAFVFMAFYYYWSYKKTGHIYKAVLSSFFFSFGVLSSYPIIFMGIYFFFIHFSFSKCLKVLGRDILIFLSIFMAMIALTILAGTKGIAADVLANPARFLIPKWDIAKNLLFTEFDYDPFVFIFFVSSIVYLFWTKNKKFLWALIPYGANYYLMSAFYFEARYTLFMIIDGAFIATFFAYFLYQNYRKLAFTIFIVYGIYNITTIAMWLNLASSKDTRLQAREWILRQDNPQNFYIYNTIGFNYLPLTKTSIEFLKEHFPKSLSTRENLHLEKGLIDGKDGAILWKIEKSDYEITTFITTLLEEGYRPIVINERFGRIAGLPQKVDLTPLWDTFKIESLETYSPYKDNSVKVNEKIGDVLLNFNYVLYTLSSLKQSGPLLTIFEVTEPK